VHVLKGVFPEDGVWLGEVQGKLGVQGQGRGRGVAGGEGEGELWDVRGRDPVQRVEGEDPLIHVFVDQLSLLFLFLSLFIYLFFNLTFYLFLL
jgi:hypothetical protein